METVIFCLLISAILMRRSAADIPFMVRGKTPPSHELRMAELRRREGIEARRTAARAARIKGRRSRGTPGRDYARALYHHSVTQAMQRRQSRWLAIDPVKAERYERKMAARAERMRKNAAARERGEKVGIARLAARLHVVSIGWPQRNGPVVHRPPVDGAMAEVNGDDSEPARAPVEHGPGEHEAVQKPEPVMSAREWMREDAFAGAKAATSDTEFAHRFASGYVERYGDTPVEERPSHDSLLLDEWLGYLRAGKRTEAAETDDPKLDAQEGVVDGTATGVALPIPVQEGSRVTAATGETTTLSQTIASIEAWESETQNAMANLELSIASLDGAEVGPSVTGAIAEARESFATAASAFAKAKAALEPSQQIGDMYNSAPDAGSKEFVKN